MFKLAGLKPKKKKKLTKAEKIDIGYRKIYAFIQRGIDNTATSATTLEQFKALIARKVNKKFSNFIVLEKRETKYLHKNGDRGYRQGGLGKLVPVPFSRSMPKSHYKGIR